MSDALTGILSSILALAQSFQLVALFTAGNGNVKRRTICLQTLSQLAFAMVYFVPLFQGNPSLKIVLFIVFLLGGYALQNVVFPAKIDWYMSQIDDKKRGSFTATKEMVSLIGGMLFSFIVSHFIDAFKESGNVRGAFVLGGTVIAVLTLLHALTLVFSHEEEREKQNTASTKKMLLEVLKDKKLFAVILLTVLWSAANYAARPFNGSYVIGELGFSLTFASIVTAVAFLTRAAFSKPMGRYADKTSFTRMLNLCFTVAACSFLVYAFTSPTTAWLYPVGNVLYYLAMAGINSGEINLIYDFVEPERRVSALALKNFLTGTVGFLTTLAVSPLISYIQGNGNTFLGLPVYAQQVANALAFMLTVAVLVYLNLVVRRLQRKKDK